MAYDKDYKDKYRRIKEFLPFEIKFTKRSYLSPSDKAKITRYDKELNGYSTGDKTEKETFGGLLSKPFITYSPRSKKNRAIAEKLAGVKPGLKLKKIPLAGIRGKKNKIRFNKNSLVMETDNIVKKVYAIDPEEFEINTEAEIKNAMDNLKPSKAFKLEINSFESQMAFKDIPAALKLLEQYIKTKHWKDGEWPITGIVGFAYKNQKSFNEMQTAWANTRKQNLIKSKRVRKNNGKKNSGNR